MFIHRPEPGKDPDMAEPKILGVREILSSFRSTLATARQTGEPVIIALRRRKPAGVLLGYETWQALKRPTVCSGRHICLAGRNSLLKGRGTASLPPGWRTRNGRSKTWAVT